MWLSRSGLYLYLWTHIIFIIQLQQNRPQNMKKDTIQSRNRKPGRKNTKKKVEQLGGVSGGSSYQEQMMSLQQQIPAHMMHPSQVMGTG